MGLLDEVRHNAGVGKYFPLGKIMPAFLGPTGTIPGRLFVELKPTGFAFSRVAVIFEYDPAARTHGQEVRPAYGTSLSARLPGGRFAIGARPNLHRFIFLRHFHPPRNDFASAPVRRFTSNL